MKVQESILKGIDVKLQPAVYVKPEAFAQMWTMNNQTRRVSNPNLVLEISDIWQQMVGGQIQIQDEQVLIDNRFIMQIDPKTKQVNKVTSHDLLELDVSEIAINRAIITLKAKGLHPDFFPTLAIVMTEQGEKFCFGETVRICSNFTVFNNKYFVDSTKASRIENQKHTTQSTVEFFKKNVFPRTFENFELDIHEIEQLKHIHRVC